MQPYEGKWSPSPSCASGWSNVRSRVRTQLCVEPCIVLASSIGKASRRRALKEREEVIANRRRYLAAIRANRDAQGRTRRPEVYLDETFVNVNHRKHLTWHVSGALVNVPAGVGERLIIVDAILQNDIAEQYGGCQKPTCISRRTVTRATIMIQ
jgi:hypothetical protein